MTTPAPIRFAVCIHNRGYGASLVHRRLYRVLAPLPNDPPPEVMLRIVDEEDEDYLYPANWFVVVDDAAGAAVEDATGREEFSPYLRGGAADRLAAEGGSDDAPARRETLPAVMGYVLCTTDRGDEFSVLKGKVYAYTQPDPNDREGDLRVIDEVGEDDLYPRDWFVPIALPREAVEALWGEAAAAVGVEQAA